MADVLRSLCQLLYKVLSFDMIRKLPSLHELLPWLLDMGVLATKRIDEVDTCMHVHNYTCIIL